MFFHAPWLVLGALSCALMIARLKRLGLNIHLLQRTSRSSLAFLCIVLRVKHDVPQYSVVLFSVGRNIHRILLLLRHNL